MQCCVAALHYNVWCKKYINMSSTVHHDFVPAELERPWLANMRTFAADPDGTFDDWPFAYDRVHARNAPLPLEPYKCVAMIMARNEGPHIAVTLRSVDKVVDAICFCDTGSDDDTVERAFEVCAAMNMPLYVVEVPWVNFAACRNRLIRFADQYAHYALCMDASDEFRGSAAALRKVLQQLDADKTIGGAHVRLQWNAFAHVFPRLLRLGHGVRYRGAAHNVPDVGERRLIDASNEDFHLFQDRAKARPSGLKYARDADYFRSILELKPEHERACFYYAQSLKDNNEHEKAYRMYATCALNTQQWNEQVYMSHYHCAELAGELGYSFEVREKHYLDAYNVIASPLTAMQLFRLYRDHDRHNQAYVWIEAACARPDPKLSLQQHAQDMNEKRWALLGAAAMQKGEWATAVRAYVQAQRNILERFYPNGTAADGADPCEFMKALFACWKRAGAARDQLFRDVPQRWWPQEMRRQVLPADNA